jgi:hypothetical protein
VAAVLDPSPGKCCAEHRVEPTAPSRSGESGVIRAAATPVVCESDACRAAGSRCGRLTRAAGRVEVGDAQEDREGSQRRKDLPAKRSCGGDMVRVAAMRVVRGRRAPDRGHLRRLTSDSPAT